MKTRSVFRQRFSTLVILVGFVFVILITSMIVAVIFWHIFTHLGWLRTFDPEQAISRFYGFLFLLMVSVFVGTALTVMVGNFILRPLHSLINATKDIAAGNFDIHLEAKGSRELARLSASFNLMAKELGSIETLRSDFISNISHEFKTPVASIRGFTQRLMKDNLTDEQRDEYLQIIVSESDRLTRLSGNVLLLSNLEFGSPNTEKAEYSLDEQLRKAVLLFEPQLQKKQLELELELESVKITANEELLHHVWLNLLGNAIKFSESGGTVKISLESKENNAIVKITDNGVGIEEDVKKRIFERFYQADSSRSSEGNGLGLSLVKKILDMENAKISLKSEAGKETEFTVMLFPF
ncbi:MAG: HAMP domain-containing histidine kinase [Defluviitaleaceae bacterium]|nr:HAMP domain-containing histidine kinase [Defluviitaleaceae bacterium]